MKTRYTALGMTLLGACLMSLTPAAHAWQDEPDLEVMSSDITFTPAGPVFVGTSVTVAADIHNVDNCYIVLGHNLDEVSYDYSFTTGHLIKIRARVRSSNGDVMTGRAHIDASSSEFVTSISGSGWQSLETGDILVPATGNGSVAIQLLTGGDAGTQLEIDDLEALRRTGPSTYESLFTREAEDYDGGGGDVDHIYPQQVQVKFYDGDPNAGGDQIGSTVTVGDVTKLTESGNVKIVTEGGVANAEVVWTADAPCGPHDIHAVILDSPREVSPGNNQASATILVASTTWTQSHDNTTIVVGSASCQDGTGITDNSYWRNYDPIDCGFTTDFEVRSCRFGVEHAGTTSGMQTIQVNIRDSTGGFPAGASVAPILGSGTVVVVDTEVAQQTFETVTFSPPIFVLAGTHVAVEVMAFNGQPQGDYFFIGSNGLGETPLDSSYVSAVDCGIVDPVPFADVGFPGVHVIIDLECTPAGRQSIGTNYCTPNEPNSTGVPGTLTATGSTSAAAMDVLLEAGSLPPDVFGYFFASRTQGFVAHPGNSSGNLCVLGSHGRYNQQGQVGSSGVTGTFQLQVGDINVPTNPSPGETISPGDSWNWQAWYRDVGNTNNFTEALNIVFD